MSQRALELLDLPPEMLDEIIDNSIKINGVNQTLKLGELNKQMRDRVRSRVIAHLPRFDLEVLSKIYKYMPSLRDEVSTYFTSEIILDTLTTLMTENNKAVLEIHKQHPQISQTFQISMLPFGLPPVYLIMVSTNGRPYAGSRVPPIRPDLLRDRLESFIDDKVTAIKFKSSFMPEDDPEVMHIHIPQGYFPVEYPD